MNQEAREAVSQGACCRQSAQGVLKDLYKCKRKDAGGLNVLIAAIPWDQLSKEEEEALWSLFVRMRL